MEERVKKAATCLLDCPKLTVRMAMLAVEFSKDEADDPKWQMKVRWYLKLIKKDTSTSASSKSSSQLVLLFLLDDPNRYNLVDDVIVAVAIVVNADRDRLLGLVIISGLGFSSSQS